MQQQNIGLVNILRQSWRVTWMAFSNSDGIAIFLQKHRKHLNDINPNQVNVLLIEWAVKYSLKITIDHSPESSLLFLTGANQKLKMP